MRTHRGFVKAVAGLALAVTALAGCSVSNDSGGSDSVAYEPAAAPDLAYEESGAMAQVAPAVGDGSVPADQSIIVTGDATVKVPSPADALAELTATVEDLGGMVSDSSSSQSGSTPSATVTARVPADKYQELVDSLAGLGEVLSSSTSSRDVGQEIADIDARIAALETSIERLTALIAEATTTTDLLQAEEMLTYRQAELDSLRAQGEYLRDQVAMSTLSVYLTTTTTQPGPKGSLAEGWEYFLRSVINLFYTIMWLLPWLILASVVLIPLLLWRRQRARRQRASVVVPTATVASPVAASPAVVEPSASESLVDDGAESGGIVSEPAEEEPIDGATEPREEPGTR